ncbi:MAG TPA: hypothetical protein VF198_01040 [Vicinamibacterales bacterium]
MRALIPAGAFVLTLSMAAVAQTPGASSQTPQPEGTARQPERPDAEAPVTLTGCLERRTAAPSDRMRPHTGNEASEAPQQYVLVVRGGDGEPAATRYTVVPEAGRIDLAPHVGQQVQVRGRLAVAVPDRKSRGNEGVSPSMPGGSSGMETMPPPRPTEEAQAPDHAPAAPPAASTVTVTAIRMLAATCR